MSAITTTPDRLRIPTAAAIQAALAEPFDRRVLKCKPGAVKDNQALAMPYLDARDVADRLDQVLGLDGWQDDYEQLADGTLLCRLRVRIGRAWITRCGVGGPSDQTDVGDRKKAAESDALKRAAVKFGVGRYLYRLPKFWLGWDATSKRFTQQPVMPAWALPKPALNGRAEPNHS
jgi:hypothetical protein